MKIYYLTSNCIENVKLPLKNHLLNDFPFISLIKIYMLSKPILNHVP